MWSTLLALLCGAGLVASAPQGAGDARASSELPVEHRVKGDDADAFGLLLDTIMKSRTATALDEIASTVTSAIGGFVDDIGDFVVGSVKELPGTIDTISERVGDAVKNGEESVVIIVKGLRNTTSKTGEAVMNTVDHFVKAVNQSKTLTSVQELEDSIRLAIARIGATFVTNAERIDNAVADGIRSVTSDSNPATSPVRAKPEGPKIIYDGLEETPNETENEVRTL